MLRMELTNELVNTDVSLNRWKTDNIHLNSPNIVQSSLLSRQVLNSSKDLGEDFIIFIEKWLLFHAKESYSTYQFYAGISLYTSVIDPQIQYDVTLWINKLLSLKPYHIQLDLTLENEKLVLHIVELRTDNNTNIDFYPYLEQESWKKLPGISIITIKNTLTIAFSN